MFFDCQNGFFINISFISYSVEILQSALQHVKVSFIFLQIIASFCLNGLNSLTNSENSIIFNIWASSQIQDNETERSEEEQTTGIAFFSMKGSKFEFRLHTVSSLLLFVLLNRIIRFFFWLNDVNATVKYTKQVFFLFH